MVKLITNIYDAKIFINDNDFIINFLSEKYNKNYSEALEIFENKKYNLTEQEKNIIQEQKENYYTWDFWNDTEYLLDNRNNLKWNFYWDKQNNEIIFNYGVKIDENNKVEDFIDADTIEIDDKINKIYKKVFDAFCNNSFEWIVETNFIKLSDDSDGSWNSKYINTEIPDFVIKYRWWEWYTYWMYEYNLVNN